MASLAQRLSQIVDKVMHGPAQLPSPIQIEPGHVAGASAAPVPFQRNATYFQVRINELYLAYSRQWFAGYDPMVFVVSEFTYDGKPVAVPFVVGPQLLTQYGNEIPEGMLFQDTRVAGVHPYKGGRLALSVILYKLQRSNHAADLLKLVESAAGALPFSTALSSYLSVAGVVTDGIEALLGLGETEPIAGLRKEFDPDAGQAFVPGYSALIAAPNADPDTFWVREGRLLCGPDAAHAQPYRDADYVLYSIVRPVDNRRSDIDSFAFARLATQAGEAAASPDDNAWATARATLVTLYQALVASPDLIPDQADELADQWVDSIKKIRAKTLKLKELAALGMAPAAPPEMPERYARAASLLDL